MTSFEDSGRSYALLTKGATHLVEEADLRRKLEGAKKEGRSLTVKVGFDPSAPDIHLGHTVLLWKMRHFQDAGHRVIFLIGDFTGMIGDPSGKKSTRPQLTREEIVRNAETYAAQCFKVLDPDKTEIRYNSEWFGKLGADGFVRLASKITVARVLERDDFARRWSAHQPISLHELMYPLSQAYDSVALKADVELGGTDQLFNLLLGRDLMREEGLEAQVVMTVPLLVGTDGVEKMSKSLGNAIGVNDPPGDMYGKIMSISDETMWNYKLLLTDDTAAEIEEKKRDVAAGRIHPMDAKKALARRIVSRFHGSEAAIAAEEEFVKRNIAQKEVRASVHFNSQFGFEADATYFKEIPLSGLQGQLLKISQILTKAGLAASNRDAQRKIEQGAVALIDPASSRVTPVDASMSLAIDPGSDYRLRVGKQGFFRIYFE